MAQRELERVGAPLDTSLVTILSNDQLDTFCPLALRT